MKKLGRLFSVCVFTCFALVMTGCPNPEVTPEEEQKQEQEQEFDVILCDKKGNAKTDFSVKTTDETANFYITSKNYLESLNIPTECTLYESDEDEDGKDIQLSVGSLNETYGTYKCSISNIPAVAGKYSIEFRVNRLDNGSVNRKVYKDIKVTLNVTGNTVVTYDAPVISSQPVGKTYDEGTTSISWDLSVTASVNNGSVSYQWYKDGSSISGANNANYTATEAGTYYVVVSNASDTAKSTKSVSVDVRVKTADELDAPVITKGLIAASYDKISDIEELSVTASVFTGNLKYQWYKDGVAISGATSSVYTPTAFGTYMVRVWAESGSKKSAEVSSEVKIDEKAVKLTVSGVSSTGYTNETLTVAASVNVENATFTYQWYETDASSGNDIIISGENNASYTPTEAGYYKCKVTAVSAYNTSSKATGYSDTCHVTVKASDAPVTPTITSDLDSEKSITEGSKIELSVTANVSDNGTLSYQWYKGSAKVGTNSSSYTKTSATTDDSGEYYVVVTNTLNGKTATKQSVKCTVTVTSTSGSGNIGFQF